MFEISILSDCVSENIVFYQPVDSTVSDKRFFWFILYVLRLTKKNNRLLTITMFKYVYFISFLYWEGGGEEIKTFNLYTIIK